MCRKHVFVSVAVVLIWRLQRWRRTPVIATDVKFKSRAQTHTHLFDVQCRSAPLPWLGRAGDFGAAGMDADRT